jgi:diguanylate cyclase (GGDEF)-like protein
VGKCCAGLTRTGDTFGRLGGEEFGLLLPDMGIDGALQTAERFRHALERLVIAHEPPIRMTASFGVAMFGEGCNSGDALLAEADRGLYLAKQSGRNRCCFAGELREACV